MIAEPTAPPETSAPADSSVENDAARFRFCPASTLSNARRESLESWYRGFLRSASSSLGELLRVAVKLELADLQVCNYGQAIAERGDDRHGFFFRMPEQSGAWLLDFPAPLAHYCVERMMGGSGASAAEATRELTNLEQTIFRQVADKLLGDFGRCWQSGGTLQPEVTRAARQIRSVRSLGHEADDLVLTVASSVSIGEMKSTLTLLMPIAAVEDFLLRHGSMDEPIAKSEPATPVRKDYSAFGSVPVPVSIRWQGFEISLGEVDALAPGDVLMLDNAKCESAVVWLSDRAKFSGRLTREPAKTKITITQPLE
jgi:flagellar motor switch protein FliM